MATAIRRHAAGRGPAPLLVVLDCKGGSDARKIADRARRVLRAAGAATTAITLAAARDDQFLVEQDLHEVAAPTSGLLRNRDHQVQQLPVAIAHRVTIFVPEPEICPLAAIKSGPWPLLRVFIVIGMPG